MGIFYFPVRRAAYLSLGVVSKFLPKRSPEIFILCYHSISDDDWQFGISAETFKKQINYLSKRYDFVSLKQIDDHVNHGKPLPPSSVAITFDDGYKDVLQVKEFIKSKGIKPTIFVMSDKKVNRDELSTDREIMSTKELLGLRTDGWEIGCHTATHSDMHNLSDAQIEKEIVKSKPKLEKTIGLPVKYIAYPKGKYNTMILKAAKRAGYSLGLTVEDGEIKAGMDSLKVPRIGVDRTHTYIEFIFLPEKLVVWFRKFMRGLGYGI